MRKKPKKNQPTNEKWNEEKYKNNLNEIQKRKLKNWQKLHKINDNKIKKEKKIIRKINGEKSKKFIKWEKRTTKKLKTTKISVKNQQQTNEKLNGERFKNKWKKKIIKNKKMG